MRQLRCFLILAEELNFTRAASRVFLSQQGFSAHIKQLETQLGTPLFVRTTRSVALSPAGKRLLEPVREALAILDAALDVAAAPAKGQAPRFKIGINPFAAGELTARILDSFRAECPGVELDLHEIKWGDPAAGLREGTVDVAFVRLPIPTDGLVVSEILSEPIVLAVSRKNQLAALPSVTVEQAIAEPVVMARSAESGWNDFWLLSDRREAPPVVGATADSHIEEMEAVAAGRASTFVPALVSRFYVHPEIRYLPIVDGPRSSLAMARRKGASGDILRTFVDVVQRVLGSEAALISAIERGTAPSRGAEIYSDRL